MAATRNFDIAVGLTTSVPAAIANAGYAGENNATSITFNLPADYIGGFTYRIDAVNGSGEAYPYPVVILGADTFIYFEIPYLLTKIGVLDLTLNIISGTTVIRTVAVKCQFKAYESTVQENLPADYVPETSATEDALNAAALARLAADEAKDISENLQDITGSIDAALDDFEQFTDTELVSGNRNMLSAVTVNTILVSDGTTIANASYTTSDYMLVAAGNTVIPSGVIPSSGSPKLRGAMAFYDREKTFISYLGADYDLFPIVPENAYYVRISFTEDITNVQVESAVTAIKVNTFTDYGDTQTGTVLATCDYPHGLGVAEAVVTNIRIVSEHYFKTLSVTIVDEYSFYFTDTFSEIESGYFTHYIEAVPLLLVPESSFKYIEREKIPPVDFDDIVVASPTEPEGNRWALWIDTVEDIPGFSGQITEVPVSGELLTNHLYYKDFTESVEFILPVVSNPAIENVIHIYGNIASSIYLNFGTIYFARGIEPVVELGECDIEFRYNPVTEHWICTYVHNGAVS